MAKRPRTKFEQSIPDYRTRILVAIVKALILPPVCTFLLVGVYAHSSFAFTIVSMILSIPLTLTFFSRYDMWAQERAASRMNARPIPHVRGKWPGNLDVMMRLLKSHRDGYIFQGFADLFAEHNCAILNTRFFWTNQIITIDEGVIKHIAATSFPQFRKGTIWHERLDKLLGTGLFNAEDEAWREGRALARPFFAKDRISDFEIFNRTSSAVLALLSARAESNKAIDVQDLFSRFSLDSASEFLFGTQLNTLDHPAIEPGRAKLGAKGSIPIDGHDEFDVFTEAFEHVAVLISQRGAKGITWPLEELFHDKTDQSIDIIMDWLDPLVRRAVQQKAAMQKAGVATTVEDFVLLDYLASTSDDIEHIRYELVTYLIASRDATSTLLTFLTYFLAMHPEVCSRLREEVLNTIGTEKPPTYRTLKSMKYLHAVLNETLRLFPSAPLLSRTSKEKPQVISTAKDGALYLPPNTQVTMLILLLHRRRDIWGDNVDEFQPERWFEEGTTARVNANPFMYCPFYGGPRACIGKEFALNKAGFLIVRMLQRFQAFRLAPQFMPEGSLPPEDWIGKPGRQSVERIQPATGLTLYSKGGLWLFAEPAS